MNDILGVEIYDKPFDSSAAAPVPADPRPAPTKGQVEKDPVLRNMNIIDPAAPNNELSGIINSVNGNENYNKRTNEEKNIQFQNSLKDIKNKWIEQFPELTSSTEHLKYYWRKGERAKALSGAMDKGAGELAGAVSGAISQQVLGYGSSIGDVAKRTYNTMLELFGKKQLGDKDSVLPWLTVQDLKNAEDNLGVPGHLTKFIGDVAITSLPGTGAVKALGPGATVLSKMMAASAADIATAALLSENDGKTLTGDVLNPYLKEVPLIGQLTNAMTTKDDSVFQSRLKQTLEMAGPAVLIHGISYLRERGKDIKRLSGGLDSTQPPPASPPPIAGMSDDQIRAVNDDKLKQILIEREWKAQHGDKAMPEQLIGSPNWRAQVSSDPNEIKELVGLWSDNAHLPSQAPPPAKPLDDLSKATQLDIGIPDAPAPVLPVPEISSAQELFKDRWTARFGDTKEVPEKVLQGQDWWQHAPRNIDDMDGLVEAVAGARPGGEERQLAKVLYEVSAADGKKLPVNPASQETKDINISHLLKRVFPGAKNEKFPTNEISNVKSGDQLHIPGFVEDAGRLSKEDITKTINDFEHTSSPATLMESVSTAPVKINEVPAPPAHLDELPIGIVTSKEAGDVAKVTEALVGPTATDAGQAGVSSSRPLSIDSSLSSMSSMQILDKYIDEAGDIQRAYKSMTSEELFALANDRKKDPEFIKRMANWKQGDPNPTALDMVAFYKIVSEEGDVKILQTIDKFLSGPQDVVSIAALGRELSSYHTIGQMMEGMGSSAGLRLWTEQIIARAAKIGDAEAIKVIGDRGRRVLINGIIQTHGGVNTIVGNANNLKVLKEIQKIMDLPDKAFAVSFPPGSVEGKYELLSVYDKMGQGLTHIMYNSILTTMSVGRASIGNFYNTGQDLAVKFLGMPQEALLFGWRRADPVRAQMAQELTRATDYVLGMWEAKMDVMAGAWETFKNPAHAIKMGGVNDDIAHGILTAPSSEDAARMSAWEIWGNRFVNLASGYNVVPRTLAAGDYAFNSTYVAGEINAWARGKARDAVQAGVIGANDVEAYVAKLRQYPDKQVLEKFSEDAGKLIGMSYDNPKANAVRAAFDKLSSPLLSRVFFPILKSPINEFENAVRHSPFGYAMKETRDALAAGGREASLARARMIIGTEILGLATVAAYNGIIRGEEQDYKKEAAYRSDGEPTNLSFIIGGKAFSVKGISPVAQMLDLGYTINKMASSINDPDMADQIILAGVHSIVRNMTPQDLVQTGSNLAALLSGKHSVYDEAVSVASRFIPKYGDAKIIANMVDDRKRLVKIGKTSDFSEFMSVLQNKILDGVPGLSTALPAAVNIFGEDVHNNGLLSWNPIAITNVKDSNLAMSLEALDSYAKKKAFNEGGVRITAQSALFDLPKPEILTGMVDDSGDVVGKSVIKLSPDEYNKYVKAAAEPMGKNYRGGFEKPLKEHLEIILKKYGLFGENGTNNITPENHANAVSDINNAIRVRRAAAKNMILNSDSIVRRLQQYGGGL